MKFTVDVSDRQNVEAAVVLRQARQKGVRLWVAEGRLHYRGPGDALTGDELGKLRSLRGEITALLEAEQTVDSSASGAAAAACLSRAPLTFSQLAHWQTYQLHHRSSIRQVASVTRFRGPLDIEALRNALEFVVRRHAALRTQIVIFGGVPVQEVSQRVRSNLEYFNLTALRRDEQNLEARRLVDELVLAPVDVATDPLLATRLLQLGPEHHLLVAAMEHMISDGASLNVFLQDLMSAYGQVLAGAAVVWPDSALAYADYAVRQRAALPSWLNKHGGWWGERLRQCGRLRFAGGDGDADGTEGWGSVGFFIDSGLRQRLEESCRVGRTTLVMSVLAVYAACVLRWCDASEVTIQCLADGRVAAEESGAIGFFASTLYLRLELTDEDRFVDLLERLMREYGDAYEHMDFSYIESQVPRPQITCNTCFNWIARDGGSLQMPVQGLQSGLTYAPVDFEHPMLKGLQRDNEPMVVLYDMVQSVAGYVYYPLKRFRADIMQRFAWNFMALIDAFLENPRARIRSLPLS